MRAADLDLRLPALAWRAALTAADRLPEARRVGFFALLVRELVARLDAAGRYDSVQVEIEAEAAIAAALALAWGQRLQ